MSEENASIPKNKFIGCLQAEIFFWDRIDHKLFLSKIKSLSVTSPGYLGQSWISYVATVLKCKYSFKLLSCTPTTPC